MLGKGEGLARQLATLYIDERFPGVAREDICKEAMFYITFVSF